MFIAALKSKDERCVARYILRKLAVGVDARPVGEYLLVL